MDDDDDDAHTHAALGDVVVNHFADGVRETARSGQIGADDDFPAIGFSNRASFP